MEALWLPMALASMFEETGDMHGEKGEPMFQGGREAWTKIGLKFQGDADV